jgi:hypothetical protein
MKKWREWLFVAILVALAVAGGWLQDRQRANLPGANIDSNQG